MIPGNLFNRSLYTGIQMSIILLFGAMVITIPSAIFTELQNGTVTGKSIIFVCFMCSLVFLTALRNLMVRQPYSVNIIDLLLGLFVLIIFVRRELMPGVEGSSTRWVELLGLAAAYTVLRALHDEKAIYLIGLFIVAGGILQVIVGLLQLSGMMHSNNQMEGITGSFFNSGPYAGFLAITASISLFLRKHNIFNHKAIKLILILNIVGVVLLLPALRSRAAILAVMTSLIFLYGRELTLQVTRIVPGQQWRKLLWGIGGGIAVFAIIYLLNSKTGSTQGRFTVLKVSGTLFSQHPLLGVGFDEFKTHYMNYQAGYFSRPRDPSEIFRADNVYYAFSEPVQLLVENGILGFGLVAIMLSIAVSGRKRGRLSNFALTAGLCVLVFSVFSYSSQILPIKIVAFYVLSILAGCYTGKYSIKFDAGWYSRFANWLRTALLGLIIVAGYVVICRQKFLYDGYREWQTALHLYKVSAFQSSLDRYKSSYPLFWRDGDFLIAYGKCLQALNRHDEAISIFTSAELFINNTVLQNGLGLSYQAVGNYISAENCFLRSNNMVPNSFYNKYLLFILYQEGNQSPKARAVGRKILSMEVKVPSPAINTIKTNIKAYLRRK